jgi:hypothetical protein
LAVTEGLTVSVSPFPANFSAQAGLQNRTGTSTRREILELAPTPVVSFTNQQLNRGINMKWITRKNIRVNRTATCWLIRRFVDPEAEFLFVPAEAVAESEATEKATGFDAPGATYPHKNAQGLCSFAALVHERLAHEPVLIEMARIVQAADIQGELQNHQAAAGLQLISHGFPLVTKDDYETVERSAFVYESLYASIMENQAVS